MSLLSAQNKKFQVNHLFVRFKTLCKKAANSAAHLEEKLNLGVVGVSAGQPREECRQLGQCHATTVQRSFFLLFFFERERKRYNEKREIEIDR